MKEKILLKVNILFILGLLEKDPEKRMNIKDLLLHPWIQKNSSDEVVAERKKCSSSTLPDFQFYACL